jgi:POT family proton-dependent oligopeptide transporter
MFQSCTRLDFADSVIGAVPSGDAGLNTPAGALGLGSVDASALVNLFTFLAYVIPIFGGIVADTKWGRFKTICVGE